MNWNGKQVLVTGAGGFIGSHLTECLVELGAEVLAFVHYNALGSQGWLDHSELKNSFQVFAGDITDRDSVKKAVDNREIVFHLAALIGIPYSYQAPMSYVRTNIQGTLNVLQSSLDEDVECIVHTSTSEVYGTAQFAPITEDHPIQGQSPYSASKIGADKMAEAFFRSFELPVVTIRPFNTFGPRQSARAVIPTIITQLLANQPIHLGNLSPTRDMNFVQNIVDGFVLAPSKPKAIGRTINLGSGREISIGDLAKLIAKIANKPINIVSEDLRYRPKKSEVDRLLADNSLAKELLEWEPKINLEEGLLLTIQWITEHMERYRTDEYVI